MNDSHVEALFYAFNALDDRHDFSQAAAWEGNLGGFDCRLEGGKLEARPQGHYPNAQSAREVLEPHLRAWELWSELNDGIPIQFKAEAARVVGTTSGAVNVEAEIASAVGIANDATVRLGLGSYPAPPPTTLAASTLVEELLGWVRELREGRQRMLVLAYLFFTRVTYEYNGEDHAAAALNISRKVLVTLRKLAGKNDPSERRKVEGSIQQLTEVERRWITAALPRITRHVAEVIGGSNPPKLNMGPPNFPSLPSHAAERP
jgi:hypothetical protein